MGRARRSEAVSLWPVNPLGPFAFVAAEIIHDGNIARRRVRFETRFDLSLKDGPVQCCVNNPMCE